MEIIEELEPVRRHIYTGYISFHDTMDLSIAIRTAVISNSRLFYAAGGAIVYDSDPENEYEETLAKADTLLTAFTGQHRMIDPDQGMAWLNGKICAAKKCAVPLDSPGFQYGAGLFETLRCDNGVPQLSNAPAGGNGHPQNPELFFLLPGRAMGKTEQWR
ncbi:MAG: chorismate-binding protein [Thermodesulfobacteriota bacterium]|nr:chorismate-binding protein [Thermodesulfobacteriota bacterium]